MGPSDWNGSADRAIDKGISFDEFRRALKPRLQQLGWWGRQEMASPRTGEIKPVQLGSTRRLRTIFQTNVATAYMAGRYQRYAANAEHRPYWRYVAVMDKHTRPAHAALHGKIWRADDPIWDIIWPPNGWGCRCDVEALTGAQFEASGQKVERSEVRERKVALNRDGDTATVRGATYTDLDGTQRVLWPDPGWDYNPGAAWPRFDAGGLKGEDIGVQALTPPPPAGVIKAVLGQPVWSDLGLPDLRDKINPRLPAPAVLPIAPDRTAAAAQLADILLPDGQPMRVIATPVEMVVIRAELLPHIVAKPGDSRERYADFIIPALETPLEVWGTVYDDGTLRKRYIALFDGPGLLLIVRENKDGSLYWDVYNVMNAVDKKLNKAREGVLLYRRPVGGQ